jgi:hypothetical protein
VDLRFRCRIEYRMDALPRKRYPSVSAEKWRLLPLLPLMRPDAPQCQRDPREVVNALRWMVRTGAPGLPVDQRPAV